MNKRLQSFFPPPPQPHPIAWPPLLGEGLWGLKLAPVPPTGTKGLLQEHFPLRGQFRLFSFGDAFFSGFCSPPIPSAFLHLCLPPFGLASLQLRTSVSSFRLMPSRDIIVQLFAELQLATEALCCLSVVHMGQWSPHPSTGLNPSRLEPLSLFENRALLPLIFWDDSPNWKAYSGTTLKCHSSTFVPAHFLLSLSLSASPYGLHLVVSLLLCIGSPSCLIWIFKASIKPVLAQAECPAWSTELLSVSPSRFGCSSESQSHWTHWWSFTVVLHSLGRTTLRCAR